MSKITKNVLIGCGIGMLIGGILFAIGTYFEKPSDQGANIQEEVLVKDVLEELDIEITTDGTNLLHNISGNSEIASEKSEIIDIEKEMENFENIEVKCRVASIELVRGKEYGVKCKFPEDEIPEVTMKGTTIQIKQDVEKNTFEGYEDEDVRTIVISIPEEVVLKNVRINNSIGDVSIDGIETIEYEVIVNTGDVEVKNCRVEECMVTGSVGEVSLEDVETENCIISLNTGDINIENCILNTCDIKDNIGTISVAITDELKDFSVDVATNVGTVSIDDVEQGKSYKVEGTGTGKLNVEHNIGDIIIKGEK